MKVVILWNIVLMIYKLVVYQSLSNPIKESIKNVILRGDFFQFWFFGAILIIYLILPILHKHIYSKENRYNKFMIGLFVINILIDILIIIAKMHNRRIYVTGELQFVRIWTWIFYFSLGGYYSKYGSKIKISMKTEILILVLIIAIQTLYQIFMWKLIYHEVQMSLTYDNIITMIYCYLVFDILMKVKIERWSNDILKELSECTLGVYIVHLKIVLTLNQINPNNEIHITILIFVLTILNSNILVYIIRKVPILNQLVKL